MPYRISIDANRIIQEWTGEQDAVSHGTPVEPWMSRATHMKYGRGARRVRLINKRTSTFNSKVCLAFFAQYSEGHHWYTFGYIYYDNNKLVIARTRRISGVSYNTFIAVHRGLFSTLTSAPLHMSRFAEDNDICLARVDGIISVRAERNIIGTPIKIEEY